jgi:hypothetical protein
MQPHSMCVVALSGLIWNSPKPIKVLKAGMAVEYRKRGAYIRYYYDLTNIEETPDRLNLKVTVMRSGGGLSCTVNARRTSREEGSEITMTHETIHVNGLREIFRLYRFRISGGRHENSERYGRYEGDFQSDDYKKLNLRCEVKLDDGSFVTEPYDLERVDLVLGPELHVAL